MPRNKHIINVHTGTGTTEPSNADLFLGEIAVQHTSGDPALWIKVGSAETSTDYEKFIGQTEITNIFNEGKVLGSAYTYSGITDVSSATTYTNAYSSLIREILEDEVVIATSLTDLDKRIKALSGAVSGIDTEVVADLEPLSASVISNSQKINSLSGAVRSASASVVSVSASVVNVNTKVQNLSGAVQSTSASVVSVNSSVQTVSASVEALENQIADTITGVTLNGSAATVTNRVAALTSSTIYAGTQQPAQSLGNNGDVYLQTDSAVLYETDGSTGLLGINDTASSLSSNWQLEDMDFTPYRYIKCYFKASSGVNNTAYTPAVIVTVQLDSASLGTTAYIGGTMCVLPFNKNMEYTVSCAVDSTKTKFQVIHQDTLWDISSSDANNNGRYLYKIEGYI